MTTNSNTPEQLDPLTEALDSIFWALILGAPDDHTAFARLQRVERWAHETRKHVRWLRSREGQSERIISALHEHGWT